MQIYLGLGSNIERERHLCAGLDALAALLGPLDCSPVFESVAVGIKSAPFFNLAVAAQTTLELPELSATLKQIEADNGRYAANRQGLPLDIDILLYGDWVGDFNGLVLPRGEILRNAFVLWPLALLAGDLIHPQQHKSMAQLWSEAQIDQQLAPVAFNWRGQALTPAELVRG